MALSLHAGCSRAYKRPKQRPQEEKTRGEERTNMERRGRGAFSRNGLALISLSRSAARQIWDGRGPKTLSSFGVLGYIVH